MRNFVSLFAAAALAVGGVSLIGCERSETDTMGTGTGTGTGSGSTVDPGMPGDMTTDGTGTGSTTAPLGSGSTTAPVAP